jgi:hypothetical protein
MECPKGAKTPTMSAISAVSWGVHGASAGGEELCLARRGSSLDALRQWGHRRPWRFVAGSWVLLQEPGGKRPFPHDVRSDDLTIFVDEGSIGFADSAIERGPQSVLIAFCVAVFCLEIGRSFF